MEKSNEELVPHTSIVEEEQKPWGLSVVNANGMDKGMVFLISYASV